MSNTLSERSLKLYQILNGKTAIVDKYRLFDLEPLLDCFFALYDLFCTPESQKRDKHVVSFIKKFGPSIDEIRRLRPSKDDFEIIRTIGKGHFGEVHVVSEKNNNDIYAMKILKKASTLTNDNIAFYEEERDVMAFARSPWITSLEYAFHDPENLYLVMEFLPGGDLLNLLNRYEDSVMEESDARFYLAEIITAVHVVHRLGYVHRDIKPENILIDMTGHLKLADFGSAAKLMGNSKVFVECQSARLSTSHQKSFNA
ncbi:Citron Rho-interacting kinase [Thelohanellus kitauei]|uniref:Citron Rho-interacting kinase n=1 Tax=Thelohanellus kitauei TaxID=669202 RepID=A0A0C2J0W5_THEKT|nr:Citron Rho-interacting kinase [Thelohanellus kitauei]